MSKAGLKKAATLLAVLSGGERERILAEFDSEAANALRTEAARLGTIPSPVVRAVLTEFLAEWKRPLVNSRTETGVERRGMFDTSDNGAFETASPPKEPIERIETAGATKESDANLLFRLFESDGTPKDYRIETERHRVEGPHFPFTPSEGRRETESEAKGSEAAAESNRPRGRYFHALAALRPEKIYSRLERERPQTAAVVLAQLADEQARRVLALFPEPAARDIQGRIERLAPLDEEILETMEKMFLSEEAER